MTHAGAGPLSWIISFAPGRRLARVPPSYVQAPVDRGGRLIISRATRARRARGPSVEIRRAHSAHGSRRDPGSRPGRQLPGGRRWRRPDRGRPGRPRALGALAAPVGSARTGPFRPEARPSGTRLISSRKSALEPIGRPGVSGRSKKQSRPVGARAAGPRRRRTGARERGPALAPGQWCVWGPFCSFLASDRSEINCASRAKRDETHLNIGAQTSARPKFISIGLV